MLRKHIHIRPIIPCSRRSYNFNRLREERNQLSIPPAHLPAGIPERAKHGIEIAPAALFQGALELLALALCGCGLDQLEFRGEALVDIMVVFDVVADVEDAGFGCHFVVFIRVQFKSRVIYMRQSRTGFNRLLDWLFG